ncbi:MAG: hypothetical protein ACLVJ6_03665 [Merdibacter sp.]
MRGCGWLSGIYGRGIRTVLLAYDAEDPSSRLEALSISKVDATGGDPIN